MTSESWEFDLKSRSNSDDAINANATAMSLDNLLRDCQSQSKPFSIFLVRFLDFRSIKSLKNIVPIERVNQRAKLRRLRLNIERAYC
jgi:hypothetical protein